MKDDRLVKHELWRRNQVESLGCDEVFDSHADGVPLCETCGCAGNMEYGHRPLDEGEGCTLLTTGSCPCRSDPENKVTDEEIDKNIGQRRLL